MNRQALVCRNILEKPDISTAGMQKNMEHIPGTDMGW